MNTRATCVLFLGAIVACEVAPQGERPLDKASEPPAEASPATGPMVRVSLPVDDGTADGIVALAWAFEDNASVINAWLDAHPPKSVAAESLTALRRNGFVLGETTLNDLPEALRALGGTSITISSWLGQATHWHQIAARHIDSPTACVVDGGSRRLEPGALQLLLRGWTVPLEEGAVTDIEIVPLHTPGGRVPGARRTAAESFPSGGLFASLARGSVLLITSDTPRGSSRMQRGPTAGPPASVPPTLGELLLERTLDESLASPRRPFLVIVPLITGAHFAAAPPVDSAAPAP